MLKINPNYKIYCVGFDETIKSLLAEGFIGDNDLDELTIIKSIKFGLNADGDPYYEAITEDGTRQIPFCMLYYKVVREANHFVVTVCKEVEGVLIPEGFVFY